MYGVPKVCKTVKDFERVHELAKAGKLPRERGVDPKELVKKQWQGLQNSHYHYVFDRVLDEDGEKDGKSPDYKKEKDGKSPDYKEVREVKEDGSTERRQFKLKENPSGKIFKLGYDPDDVQAKIEELGG